MANDNSYSWIMRFLAFLFVLVVAAVGAPIWIESRISASVTVEAKDRKDADIAIEARQEKRMERIEGKLDNIEQYIREQ